jgi:hypothetical protein
VKELAGRMLSRQSVRSRLDSEQGISLTEFSYQAFQAYDWLRLYQGRSTPEQIQVHFILLLPLPESVCSPLKGQYFEKIEWGMTGVYRPTKKNLQILFFSNLKKIALCVYGEYS